LADNPLLLLLLLLSGANPVIRYNPFGLKLFFLAPAGASPEVSGFALPPPEKVVLHLHGVFTATGAMRFVEKNRECGFP
jgi:hypothetical protein